MSASPDPVMQALAYPFDRDLASLPDQGGILLANALPGPGPWEAGRTAVWQWWKGPATGFEKAGFRSIAADPGTDEKFNAVFLRLPRQREEAQFVMATAWNVLEEGGLFMAAAANDAGGARLEKDLKSFFPALQSASKHKCRIVWVQKGKDISGLPKDWIVRGRLQKHGDPGVWTRPGLFSWDRIDTATEMLLSLLPTDLSGRVADLGCGTGVIANHILKNNAGVKTMLCMDADARAVEACGKNLAERYPGRDVEYHWVDLSQPQVFTPVNAVIMNPPFHAEKTLAIALGQSFIRNAAAMLKTGGNLWMVANAHLPYEPGLLQAFKQVEKIQEARGFKIIRGGEIIMAAKQLKPQGILWDLDNTLYRLDDTIERAVNLAVAKAAINLGADMPVEEAMKLAHESWLAHRHSAHYFIERYGFTLADIHHETDRMLAGTLVQKCHETRDLFDRLPASHALITHAARPWALRTLEHLELKPWFPDQQIFAYEDFEFESKARSRRSFNTALAAIDMKAEVSMMVEDTIDNLRVPHEMGMTTILLHHGQKMDEYPSFVDFTFTNAREFLTALVSAR